MKIPSIARLPKYKSFAFKPRHYDPIKEEVEERKKRIEASIQGDGSEEYESSIAGSFRKKSGNYKSYSQNAPAYEPSVMRLAIALALLGGIVGYLYMGNQIVYYLLAAALAVYLLIKFRGLFSNKSRQ